MPRSPAGSGCPYPFHYCAASGEVSEVQMDAYPLGVRSDTRYSTIETRLQEGDYVVFYSDGIVEAENEAGEFLDFAQVGETIRAGCAAGLRAEALIDVLLTRVKAFVGALSQADDMTCVVLRVLP